MSYIVRLLSLLCLFALADGNEQKFLSTPASKAYITYLKNKFEHEFHNKCDKYPFVQHFSDLVEKGSDKQIMFVYHEDRLRNGGLGDRFAGLISAVTIALRFNRTLVFRDKNEVLMKLYRPYHQDDIHEPSEKQKYLWSNQFDWSHYNIKNANNDDTEYDLWNCVNNVGQLSGSCCLESVEDVKQPTILYRSNRAYLCRQDINMGTIAHRDFQRLLGPFQVNTNLYEVAGCMLRLALWPTDYLWNEIEDKYANFFRNQNLEQIISPRDAEDTQSSFHKHHHTLPVHVYQVSAHYRCGDSGFLHHGQYDEHCVFKPGVPESGQAFGGKGSPFHIGLCAKEAVYNRTIHHQANRGSLRNEDSTMKKSLRRAESFYEIAKEGVNTTNKNLLPILFLTSDNPLSTQQMASAAEIPNALIAPQGCHIELDASFDCHKFTLTYWMILGLSDKIIHQTIVHSQKGSPVSAFSRYAGMYSLKDRVFIHVKQTPNQPQGQELIVVCSDEYNQDLQEMRHQQGNWFC